jgi:signal transduction histidine kinase
VCGFGEVVCSLSLLIRRAQRAHCQAETPLIVLCRFPGPALSHAIALGMLTHELITNAFKHANLDSASGAIQVTLKHNDDGSINFRFADNGGGLPVNFQIETTSSLGMKVINSTVRQLGGTLEINRLDPGTEFVIHLPSSIEQRPQLQSRNEIKIHAP